MEDPWYSFPNFFLILESETIFQKEVGENSGLGKLQSWLG